MGLQNSVEVGKEDGDNETGTRMRMRMRDDNNAPPQVKEMAIDRFLK